jgi:hypothetical protein
MDSRASLEARMVRMAEGSRDFQIAIDQQNGYLKFVYSGIAVCLFVCLFVCFVCLFVCLCNFLTF